MDGCTNLTHTVLLMGAQKDGTKCGENPIRENNVTTEKQCDEKKNVMTQSMMMKKKVMTERI